MRKKRVNGLGGGGGIGILSSNRPQSATMGAASSKKVRFQKLDLKGQGVAGALADVNRYFEDGTGNDLDVKFFSKGGRQTQSVQIYQDIDELNKLSTSGKGVPSGYSIR